MFRFQKKKKIFYEFKEVNLSFKLSSLRATKKMKKQRGTWQKLKKYVHI